MGKEEKLSSKKEKGVYAYDVSVTFVPTKRSFSQRDEVEEFLASKGGKFFYVESTLIGPDGFNVGYWFQNPKVGVNVARALGVYLKRRKIAAFDIEVVTHFKTKTKDPETLFVLQGRLHLPTKSKMFK